MAFYLLQARYSTEAIKAMIQNPSDRKKAAEELIAAAGGKLHHFFFAFGEHDIVVLIEAPDDAAMAAAGLAVASSGTLSSQATTKLIPIEEAMAAMRKAQEVLPNYRPPMG